MLFRDTPPKSVSIGPGDGVEYKDIDNGVNGIAGQVRIIDKVGMKEVSIMKDGSLEVGYNEAPTHPSYPIGRSGFVYHWRTDMIDKILLALDMDIIKEETAAEARKLFGLSKILKDPLEDMRFMRRLRNDEIDDEELVRIAPDLLGRAASGVHAPE